jgi:hypothetical protein
MPVCGHPSSVIRVGIGKQESEAQLTYDEADKFV